MSDIDILCKSGPNTDYPPAAVLVSYEEFES